MRSHTALLGLASLFLACAAPPAEAPAQPEAVAATVLENGSFTTALDGVDIHYEIHGEGPVLMTLPNSWGLSLEGLRLLYRPLEERLTLVYFDPRGMGASAPVREDADMGVAAVRADFDALRRHLGLEKVHAIGWSNGAMNLLLLASDHPEILSSAIFLHGTARFGPEDMDYLADRYPELFAQFTAFQQEANRGDLPPDELNERVKRFNLEVWFPYMFADWEAARARIPDLYRDVEFSWRHSQYSQAEMPMFDARERLAAITVPSLVIAGAHDMLPPERAEEIDAGIPDSRFVLFEGSGHFAPLEEPELFVRTVAEFLGAL